MLVRALVVGAPFTLGVVLLTWFKVSMDARGAPIVVVDHRTLSRAIRRIVEAAEEEDYTRAYNGLTVVSQWLEEQIATGPRRRRGECATIKPVVDEALAAARYILHALPAGQVTAEIPAVAGNCADPSGVVTG
jgi:hypothetical protein